MLNYKKPAFWLVLAAVLALIAAAVFFLTDRPAAELETELEFRDVTEFPKQFDAEGSRDLTYEEAQGILTGPDAALVLDSKRTDELYAHALFSGDQTFSGVVLGRQNLSLHGSYVVLKEEISIVPGAVPINGEAFQQTCTVRGTPVDAQRWQNDGYTWFTTDFVRRDSDGQAYAVHVGVLCVPREGDTERDCIRRLYEIVDSFLNPENKVSLDAISAAYAEMDEQMELLRHASPEQLINLFPRTDGAYTETLIAQLADAARGDYDYVQSLIEESSLTAEQKAQLQADVLRALEGDHAYMSAVLPDAQGNLTVPLYDLQVTLPEAWKGRVIGVGTQTGPGYWLSVCSQQLIDAYEEYDFSQGQGWRDSIFWVCAVDKQTHPNPALDFPSGAVQPVLIGESDWMRIYACVGPIPGHDSFETIRAQFIGQIGQARYEELAGDFTVDESQLRDYVHVREGVRP